MAAGTTQASAGQIQVATGTALSCNPFTAAAGAPLIAAGTTQITTGTALIGSGTSFMVAGITMAVAGAGQIATGAMQMSMGNEKIADGTKKLSDAADLDIISKEQASVGNKEMIRSQIFESKHRMLEDAQSALKAQNEALPESQRLSEEQLKDMGGKMDKSFDDCFKKGGDAIKNNGIMTFQDDQGAGRFFKLGDEGIQEINIKQDDSGKPLTDEFGRLQEDDSEDRTAPAGFAGLSKADQGMLVLDFSVLGQMEEMIKGKPADPTATPPTEAIPPLARVEINPTTGEVSSGKFDINNPQHMKEFSELVDAAQKNPPPLRYFEENGELFFQKWDWAKNEGIGEKVSLKEMSGGTIDEKDPKWLEKAQATAKAAYEKAGLGEDSEIYQLLKPLAQESASNDAKPIPVLRSYGQTVDVTAIRDRIEGGNNTSSGIGNNSNRLSLA